MARKENQKKAQKSKKRGKAATGFNHHNNPDYYTGRKRKSNGRQGVTRGDKGHFALGNASGGRPKGISNKLTQEIRLIIDENKDVFLHRLFKAAGMELDNYIRILQCKDYGFNEDGELVQFGAPSMTASILVNQLVLKSLPAVKHISISKTEKIMAAIVNLTGRDAVNYLEEKEDLAV